MYVCLIHVSVMSCVGSEHETGRSSVQAVLPSVYKSHSFQSMKWTRGPNPSTVEDELYS